MGKLEGYIDVFHVGMPKCASTFLQRSLFSPHEEINDFSPATEWWNVGSDILTRIRNKLGTSGFNESEEVEKLKKAFKKKSDKRGVNLLSWEHASGPTYGVQNNAAMAEFAKKHMGNIKIILVLRNQYDWIFSAWKSSVRVGYPYGIKKFLKKHEKEAVQSDCVEIYEKLLYNYINVLYENFGEENVSIFFLEDLKENSEKFIKNVCENIGVKEKLFDSSVRRKSFGLISTMIMRSINGLSETPKKNGFLPNGIYRFSRRLLSKTTNNGIHVSHRTKEKDVKSLLPKSLVQKIKRSNRIASKKIGRSLENIGYDT